MLYELLVSFFVLNGLFMVLIILMQKGQSSLGLGSMGGGAQMLFGASGGQDIFQKITWVCGTLFMTLALLLSLMRARSEGMSKFLIPSATEQVELAAPATPLEEAAQASAPEEPATEAPEL